MTDDLYRRERLTLRVKPRQFLDALRAHGVPQEQMPLTTPLCGELLFSYAFEQANRFVMATPPLLAQADVAPGDCEALALANFKGRFSAQLVRTEVHPGLFKVRTGGNLEAVLLAFPAFWQSHVSNEIGQQTLVCAPRPDVVLIADVTAAGAVQALRSEAARAFHANADAHALSQQLMQWTASGWRLSEAPEEQAA